MLKRAWDLHRNIIVLGLLSLGFGTWLTQDAESYTAIVLKSDASSMTLYLEDGRTIAVETPSTLSERMVVEKVAGEACCRKSTSIEATRRTSLEARYQRYRSTWRGEVVGFVMRTHADDADTAIVSTETGERIEWKVWESHLAGLRKGERLCKSEGTWAPERCPSRGVEFQLQP